MYIFLRWFKFSAAMLFYAHTTKYIRENCLVTDIKWVEKQILFSHPTKRSYAHVISEFRARFCGCAYLYKTKQQLLVIW